MKINRRFLFVFYLIIFVFSCEVRLQDNTRVLVKGDIEDGFGNPINNASIGVYRGQDYVFPFAPLPSFSDTYLLGENFSGADGSFFVTSLYDKNQYFTIVVEAGESFTKYVYQSNTENFIPNDLTFDLGTLTLYKFATFNYNIAKEGNTSNTLQFSFNYINPFCVEVYEQGILNTEVSNCYVYQSQNIELSDSNPNIQSKFIVPLGANVEFTYSINGAPFITENLLIETESYEFEFYY